MTDEELLPKCEEYFNMIKINLPYNSRFKNISVKSDGIYLRYDYGLDKIGTYKIKHNDIIQFIRNKKLNDLGI